MRAITAPSPGGPEALLLTEVPDPVASPGEVVIDVAASALNRADLLQRMGFYPPPPGASDILGMECSGTIAEVGADVTEWSVGDEVCALLAAGGYADKVVVPAGQVMRIPAGLSPIEAAALPEVAATVWSNVFMIAKLRAEDTFLVHGGAGGIGTFAIQLAKAFGATVLTTAGSAAKLDLCRSLGADVAIDYREENSSGAPRWLDVVREHGGADVILDNMGAKYLGNNVKALATEGRLVIIGMQGGVKGELDIAGLLSKRGAVIATSLRARPESEKSAICRGVEEYVWPLVEDGSIRAVVEAQFPLAEAAAAHRLMESGTHTGKIVLVP